MPPTIMIDQIKGFSLFMIEAVLDRRGNEIIESTLDEQDIFERAGAVAYKIIVGQDRYGGATIGMCRRSDEANPGTP